MTDVTVGSLPPTSRRRASRVSTASLRQARVLHELGEAVVSVNDTASIAPYERLVTFNDAQRILMLALLKQAETAKVMEGVQRTRSAFWDSRMGRISIWAAIVFGLIMALCALYEVFFGLSHSVLGSG